MAPWLICRRSKTSDGDIILACGNDNLFKKFCEAAGYAHLAQDPRFSINAERVKNREEITRLLNEVFAQRPTREGCSCSTTPVSRTGRSTPSRRCSRSRRCRRARLKIELPHASAGKVPLVASPMRFSETPIKHEVPPPALGQHTDEILRGMLKKSAAEIAKLKEGGVV